MFHVRAFNDNFSIFLMTLGTLDGRHSDVLNHIVKTISLHEPKGSLNLHHAQSAVGRQGNRIVSLEIKRTESRGSSTTCTPGSWRARGGETRRVVSPWEPGDWLADRGGARASVWVDSLSGTYPSTHCLSSQSLIPRYKGALSGSGWCSLSARTVLKVMMMTEGQCSRCKIVVVGDTQCGKTALLHVFAKDSYPEVNGSEYLSFYLQNK